MLCRDVFSWRQEDKPLGRQQVLLHTKLKGSKQELEKTEHNLHKPQVCDVLVHLYCILISYIMTPQWGAADAETKVPSGANTELKRSPFQAWSRSVYSHTCYAYCQGRTLPCLFLPFQSIHLHFFQNLSQFFPVLACRIK